MRAEDLRELAGRDWNSVEELKGSYWATRKASMTPAEALTMGDDLRCYAREVRPDWPSESERAEDLESHERVSRGLRLVVVPVR